MPFYINRLSDLYAPGCFTEMRVIRQGTAYTRWVRAVCVPDTAGRIFAAWEILRGRAYAFEWPKPGDLEKIIAQTSDDRIW
jgi:hypothetical protein